MPSNTFRKTALFAALFAVTGLTQASPADDAVRGAVLPTNIIGAVDDGTPADTADAQAATEELPVIDTEDAQATDQPNQ